jgi:HD-like signal output (HDOD) protein
LAAWALGIFSAGTLTLFHHPPDISGAMALASPFSVRERAVAALDKLPPFSPILNNLIASLTNEDVSFAKIADLIEKDTVLAGNILRLVNSALYGLPGTVHSVRHAVALLGLNKLRNASMIMSVARMWKIKTPPGWSIARFNLHSVGVAILSDLLAHHLNVPSGESAFAAGLFHDLGLLMLAVGLPEEYKQITLLLEQDPTAGADHEMQVLGATHAELSADALAVWKLPEPIQIGVRYHINPELDPTPTSPGQMTLSRVVNCADRHVRELGVFVKLFEEPGADDTNPLESLGLGEHLPVILSEFESQFSSVQPYF